jgi:CRISPR system subtype II-B RNA-guided endonuclease Cas9/Csx12
MNNKKMYISPIAIDLGAAHTGVYSAFYEEGSSPKDIDREGRVYHLDNRNYTLLMNKRTTGRHQRRGFDRRQMAKRLVKLIWEEKFQLKWDDDVAQTVGFLMNRRGFSYLSEEYDKEALREFPVEAWAVLPDEFKKAAQESGVEFSDNHCDLALLLQQLTDDQNQIETALDLLVEKTKYIRTELFFYSISKKIKEYCKSLIEQKDVSKMTKIMSGISRWIVDRLMSDGVRGFDSLPDGNSINLVEYFQQYSNFADSVYSTIKDYSSNEKECKISDWNFKETTIDLEKINLEDTEHKDNKKNHIHHLAYALYSINTELISGSRHRKKYFKEVHEVLSDTGHTHGYLKRFCGILQNNEYGILTVDKLSSVMSHISNLELKPLRKYFNDEAHKDHDYWDEQRLTNVFEKWIFNEWRVHPENNPEKGEGKEQDYKALCQRWKDRSGSIVDFWMRENPVNTIPPYQNKNNRRPPRCQSLILNAEFLTRSYPEWLKWVKDLKLQSAEYLGNMEDAFMALRSGKNKPYFSDSLSGIMQTDSQKRTMADLDTRIFQFLLDRRKDTDPFKLNEIYSYTKKIRQLKQKPKSGKEQKEKQNTLNEILQKSSLPGYLKTEPDYQTDEIFSEGTFLHFICRYYKLRQRAKDGRLFIHHEYKHTKNRGYEKRPCFNHQDQLLTYCNHKPRRKKYQSFYDVVAILLISEEEFLDKVDSKNDEDVVQWLKSIRGLEGLCRDAAKAQKEHRGELKQRMARAGAKTPLGKLKKKSETVSKSIGERLFGNPDDPRIEKFSSVFSFAQLYNIAFTERSGNSNTCPVCSLDNSRRMEIDTNDKNNVAKAQRLPAISTRLIDGAVMRMARILSKQIVNDNWKKIEARLRNGNEVRVPIITESNRFEFEPELRKLKGKSPEKEGTAPKGDSKTDRIKRAANKICPYTGDQLGDNGEIDHIIPRSSQWGTLNDEANLIYAGKKGNKDKGRKIYSLANLTFVYKKSLFGTDNDREIEVWIEETIWDDSRKDFTFGRYLSFINLTSDQQRAFRHALFLPTGNPIRDKVISAINNRTRTLVNGTQRYFVETIADEFHKKALKIGKAKFLSFDYFGIEAVPNSRGEGIKEWRWFYEMMYGERLEDSIKVPEKVQTAYSHLLDAQLAFLITIDKHRNEGSFRIDIPDDVDMQRSVQKRELVFGKDLFQDIWIRPEEFEEVPLMRRKAHDGFSRHRAFTRDTFYADHYLPLLFKKKKDETVEVRAGFDWKNSGEWKHKKKDISYLQKLLPLCKQREFYPEGEILEPGNGKELYDWLISEQYFQRQVRQRGYLYLTMDKKAFHDYLVKYHNTKTGDTFDDFADFCYQKIGYRTEKRKLVIEGDGNISETIDNGDFIVKFGTSNIELPIKYDWEKLYKQWKESGKESGKFDEFLVEYFLKKQPKQMHQKTRKNFSLQVKSGQGTYLLKRNGWQGSTTYQIAPDSDSRKQHNKAIVPVLTEDGALGEKLSSWAEAKNFVKLSKDKLAEGKPIDPLKWFQVNKEKTSLPEGVDQLWFRIDDKTRPSIAIKLGVESNLLSKDILELPLCRLRDYRNNIDTFWDSDMRNKGTGEIVQYKGDSYNKIQYEAFKTATEVDKPE